MMYFKWVLFIFYSFIAKFIVNFPLAPIIVLFANKDGWLPNWLYWFQTPDNSLDGDNGWKTESRPILKETNRFKRWYNRFRWLHRNATYGFSEQILGFKYLDTDTVEVVGNPNVGNGPLGNSGLVKRYLIRNKKRIAFQWYYVHQYKFWPTKCIRINLGWKLWNFPGSGYANFVCSPSPTMHFIK